MSNKETGGPAFPINVDSEMTCLGMTLRDYFAAKAMQGVLSNPHIKDVSYKTLGETAYQIADAMLSARSTEKVREV